MDMVLATIASVQAHTIASIIKRSQATSAARYGGE
jgi:hypothetical protein